VLTPAAKTVRLTLLGAPGVTKGGNPTALLTGPRRLAVLAYLATARPRGLHSRETLIALFWPEANTDSGRHALRNVLHAIRSALGDCAIQTAGDGMVGINAELLECDVFSLEADLAKGRAECALDGNPGELLRGFHISGAPAFERWLDIERRRLLDVTLDAAWNEVTRLSTMGDSIGALRVTRKASELAPDDERWLRRLVEAFAAVADRTSAEHAYETFARHLAREYEAEPSPQTQSLMARIRGKRLERVAAAADIHHAATARPTMDSEAWILYVRGTYLFLRAAPVGDVRELERSRAFCEEALERDPRFAPAYAGLSNYYAVSAVRNILRPFDKTFVRTIELSHRALAWIPPSPFRTCTSA